MSVPTMGTLRGQVVSLRPVEPSDAAPLTEILTHSDVAAWWGHWDLTRVQHEMISPTDGTVSFAVEVDGQLIGLIQYWEEDDPDYRHARIDIFLDPAWHGRGLGTDTVRTVARYLFAERGHRRLTIDPAAHNQRAIRSYRRVGFQPVGIMRRYERGPDGSWHDGLLMDLLPEDVVEPEGRRRFGQARPDTIRRFAVESACHRRGQVPSEGRSARSRTWFAGASPAGTRPCGSTDQPVARCTPPHGRQSWTWSPQADGLPVCPA